MIAPDFYPTFFFLLSMSSRSVNFAASQRVFRMSAS